MKIIINSSTSSLFPLYVFFRRHQFDGMERDYITSGKCTNNIAKTLYVFLQLKRKIAAQCLDLHLSSVLKALTTTEDPTWEFSFFCCGWRGIKFYLSPKQTEQSQKKKKGVNICIEQPFRAEKLTRYVKELLRFLSGKAYLDLASLMEM